MNAKSTLFQFFPSLTPVQQTALVATGCVIALATGGAAVYAIATTPALAVSFGSAKVLTGAAAVAYASRR